jgi:hypothetical protein
MVTCRHIDARVKQAPIARADEFARLIPAHCTGSRFMTMPMPACFMADRCQAVATVRGKRCQCEAPATLELQTLLA